MKRPEKPHTKILCRQAPFHQGILDVALPLCDLHGDIMDKSGLSVPDEDSDKAVPVCCHLEKSGKKIQAVTSPTKSPRTDRFTVAGIHAVLSDGDTLNSHRSQAIADYTIHPRAAPVPLYLKNASFIC